MPYITTEQVKEKRQAIKKAFPEFKFSITKDNHSGIRICIMAGPSWFAEDGAHEQLNAHCISDYSEDKRANKFLQDLTEIAKEGHKIVERDTDYGNWPNFYVWLEVAKWDKPYKVVESKKEEEKPTLEVKETEQDMVKFEAGKSYTYGYVGDSTIKVKVNIVRRTEKSIWFTVRNNKEVKRAKINIYEGEENFAPDGTGYSMSPRCYASKLMEEEVQEVIELTPENCEEMSAGQFEEKATQVMEEAKEIDTVEKPATESAFSMIFGGIERKKIDTDGMLLHKHLEIATRAHNGTSFSPERRGKQYIKDYSELLAEDLETVRKYDGDAVRYRKKFERLFVDWMHSKANCISSMITGPSKFPTGYANKRNNWERNKANALEDWRDRALKAIKKAHRKANAPDPIQAAKKKYEQEKAMLERMKEGNKVAKSRKLSDEEKVKGLMEKGFTEGSARNLITPDFANRIGFASWQLTNCRNRMKAAKARYDELNERANTPSKEEEREDGIRVVDNVAENRLQVFFPDKPDPDTRTKLKKNGFRWTPSRGCWQAYLNSRSREKLLQII